MKLPALLILLSAAAAYAGPRASTNYSIATDTLDAGGRRTTSASYTNDGSAGGIIGIFLRRGSRRDGEARLHRPALRAHRPFDHRRIADGE